METASLAGGDKLLDGGFIVMEIGTRRRSRSALCWRGFLKGDRKGQYSIRINDQFRICFRWTPEGAEFVEIVDYH